MQTKMAVTGLTIDPVNNAPIVILREELGGRILPIWIGVIEASAIAFELEKVQLSRPMTHDLLKSAIEVLGGSVQQVSIVGLKDNTYFAVIAVTNGDKTVELDARPSDAIALALRMAAPIFCESTVIDQAHLRQQGTEEPAPKEERRAEPPPTEGEDEERGESGPKPLLDLGPGSTVDVLENLDPEAFGKYKM